MHTFFTPVASDERLQTKALACRPTPLWLGAKQQTPVSYLQRHTKSRRRNLWSWRLLSPRASTGFSAATTRALTQSIERVHLNCFWTAFGQNALRSEGHTSAVCVQRHTQTLQPLSSCGFLYVTSLCCFFISLWDAFCSKKLVKYTQLDTLNRFTWVFFWEITLFGK